MQEGLDEDARVLQAPLETALALRARGNISDAEMANAHETVMAQQRERGMAKYWAASNELAPVDDDLVDFPMSRRRNS